MEMDTVSARRSLLSWLYIDFPSVVLFFLFSIYSMEMTGEVKTMSKMAPLILWIVFLKSHLFVIRTIFEFLIIILRLLQGHMHQISLNLPAGNLRQIFPLSRMKKKKYAKIGIAG